MKQEWNTEKIQDQAGRVIIITGASSGIGKAGAKILAEKNATVVLAVRNTDKGEAVVGDIKAELPQAKLQVMKLDLSSLKSVKEFADNFFKEFDRLDLLINNAGVMMCPYSQTEDGFEIQMGTNHLGHFALTGLLMPLLMKTKDSSIVNTSSLAHRQGNIDFSDIDWMGRTYQTGQAYGDSKIANIYFTNELVRRLEGIEGAPLVTAAHPGWTATELQRHINVGGMSSMLQEPKMGILPSLMAAYDEDAKPGDFYGPSGPEERNGYPTKVASNTLSHNIENAKKLWEISEEKTKVKYLSE